MNTQENKSEELSNKEIEELEKRNDALNQPAPDTLLTIMLVNELEGFNYVIQQIGQLTEKRKFFQYIIFDAGSKQFYQTYVTVAPDKGEEHITLKEIARALVLVQKMVETTIVTLIKQRDPTYKLDPDTELIRDKAQQAFKVLEKVGKIDAFEKKK